MQLGIEPQIPDGLLAANALLAENSRQGVPTSRRALHQGFEFAISSTVLGFQFRCSESASDPVVAPSNAAQKKQLACLADVAINFGLGFIPGYNAVKLAGTLSGANFNFIENAIDGKSVVTFGPSPIQAASGLASAYSLIKTMNFNDAGGLQQFTRMNALTGGGWANARTAINELEGAASSAGTVANLLNGASAVYDAVQCGKIK